jgi:hypothetical protein
MTNFTRQPRSLAILLALVGAVRSPLCHADDLPDEHGTTLHTTETVSTAHEAAYRLADPIPNVVSLPFQLNYDRGYGEDGEGRRFTGKVQPVIPITLSEKYVYYVRTVVPYEWKSDGDGYNVDGFGVPLIETFLSSTIGERNEFRIGPFLSPPALSGSRFGTQQTGGGVSWLGIMRPDDWAIGILGYQSFAIGGSDAGGTATSTYLQPFISYITKNAWTYSVNLESTTSWNPTSTSLPLNLTLNKAIMLGDLPISFAVGGRYYLASLEDGASGFGGRAQITVVLPRWS